MRFIKDSETNDRDVVAMAESLRDQLHAACYKFDHAARFGEVWKDDYNGRWIILDLSGSPTIYGWRGSFDDHDYVNHHEALTVEEIDALIDNDC